MRPARAAEAVLRRLLPLALRVRLAVWIGRQRHLPGRSRLPVELLRDLAAQDPEAFHRLLWSRHLAYARFYEVDRRFGPVNLQTTRRLLLADVRRALLERGIQSETDVHSVLDVGCSLGYVLRHIETDLCPSATVLHGLDIDGYAVRAGARHLQALGSRVHLATADMCDLNPELGTAIYDVVLCAGALLYLSEANARRVVAMLLRHTNHLLALTGLAHPQLDNALLADSERRAEDGGLIHNLDAMVHHARGTVVARRWQGAQLLDGQSVYFVLAAPAAPAEQ